MRVHAAHSLALYRFKKFAILLFFIAYSVVQCAGAVHSPRGEYFPVFSWSLFSTVKDVRRSLEIEITRIGDTTLPEPVNFFELDEHFAAAERRTSTVIKSAVRFAKVYRADPARGEAMRRVFEETYLSGPGRVDYQFVAVRYDPVRRWRSGEVIERDVLVRFSTEEAR